MSPGSELMTGTNISNLPKIKITLSDFPFVKYYKFEINVNFPPIDSPTGIVAQ